MLVTLPQVLFYSFIKKTMDTNPYSPPSPGAFAAELPAVAGELHYAGFWQRLGAYLVDVIVLLPLIGLAYWMGEQSRLFSMLFFVPSLLIGLWFSVYLVKRYGGTPGKLVLKTRIAMVDGSPVTLKAALLRHAVLFILSALSSLGLLMATLAMSDELYLSLGYMQRSTKLVEMAPGWYYAVSVLMQIWIWGEFITMMFNKRRRAVHDYIAGTVVLRNVPKK